MSEWQTIPGETPIDRSGLRPSLRETVHTREQLNVVEAENVRRAIVKYLAATPSRRLAPFTLDWVLKLHKEMLARVWVWAGKVRAIELNIGSPPWRVLPELHDLLEDLRLWETSQTPLVEQAATLHYRAVLIHPFENGNGRWARLLANIWLKRHGEGVTVWPEDGITQGASSIRGQYIAALKAADKCDMIPLIELHKRFAGER